MNQTTTTQPDGLEQLEEGELNAVFEREVLDLDPLRLCFASSDGGKSGALFEENPFRADMPITRDNVERFCAEYPQYKVCFREVT